MLPSAPNSYISGADCRLIIKYDPSGDILEGQNYWLTEPHTFNYQPYEYPHPLVSGVALEELTIKATINGVQLDGVSFKFTEGEST